MCQLMALPTLEPSILLLSFYGPFDIMHDVADLGVVAKPGMLRLRLRMGEN